jgi:aryl-alcohol dehydrogenase-like predicted oxidoreductase
MIELIGKALKEGVNFFDTAYVYGNGKNEELLGKVILKIIIIKGNLKIWTIKIHHSY